MTSRTHDFRATTWQMTLMGIRYLNGRRLRTVLTTLAIVFGVALIFAINLVLPSGVEAFNQILTSITGADVSSASGRSFVAEPVLNGYAVWKHANGVGDSAPPV
jgi:hypothetical protein